MSDDFKLYILLTKVWPKLRVLEEKEEGERIGGGGVRENKFKVPGPSSGFKSLNARGP